MAKSLRSKSKTEFRRKKRQGTGSTNVFKKAYDERMDRLSNKLMAGMAEKKEKGKEKALEEGDDDGMDAEGDKMEDGGEEEGEPQDSSSPKSKVSTSGPRLTRRELFRTSRNLNVRRAPKTYFGVKGGGKTKRRR